ncbi:reverse transcriptase domain-containing protein [Tanacetum coccineum]
MAYWATPVRCFGVLGYGILGYSGKVFCTSWVWRIELLGYGVLAESVLFLIFDQSIIYDVYTDVDTAYSSKSGNGLLIRQSLGYGRLRCKGVTKQIIGVVPKGLALWVVLVDLHSKDESGKGFKREVTSTFRHPKVSNTSIKLLLFPFSLEGEARTWLDKEPPRSILTWDDLISKFINQFFPPSKTTYLRNKITTFYQEPNETFNEAWERFKGLLRQCPHHGFSELHQLDTFYNSLNTNDQDALDSAAGGNFLDKMPRDGLAIIKSKSKVRYSRSRAIEPRQINAITTRSGKTLEEPSTPLIPPPVVPNSQKEPEQNPETSTEKVQNPNLENTAHVPPLEEEDSIFIEIPKPKAKKNVNVEIQDLNSPRPNSYQSKLPYPERMKLRLPLKDALVKMPKFNKWLSSLLKNKEKLEEIDITTVNAECSAIIMNKVLEKLEDREKFLYPMGSTNDPFSGSTTIPSDAPFPSSSLMKTSDSTFEEFTDEFTLPNSLPPGNDDSIHKKDIHEETFRIYSNPLFEFDNNFKSSDVNPLFEEKDKDVEIKSSSSFTLTSPEENELEAYLERDSIPSGIDLNLPPTLEVLSSNPTSPTLIGEKDLKKDFTVALDSTESSILPPPLLDSDSPFTAELSASITLNSLRNEDKVFNPGIFVYHAIHDKNLVTLEKNLRENVSSGTLLFFKEPSSPRPPLESPDVEKCLEPEAGIVITKVFKDDFMTDILPTLSTLVSDLTFILFLSSFLSFGNEDTIFDPGIVTFPFSYLEPVAFSIKVSCSKCCSP